MRRRLEILGRRLIVFLLGLVLGARVRPVTLGPRPRLLVVRLDERVGNVIMLTPLLASLKTRFPNATIDLLTHVHTLTLLASHPAVTTLVPFDKRALLASHGPLRTVGALRRRRYDLAIDATNPTDPSATQAILVRLSGARHTVGFNHPGFGRLFTQPVHALGRGPHEIDMRLALLEALPGSGRVRSPALGVLPTLNPGALKSFIQDHAARAYAVINVGARLPEKRLSPETYAALATLLCERGLTPVLAYGPSELELARGAQTREQRAVLAPPTNLIELGHLMRSARCVVSCDTGPMHLAVALGVPTCGLFVTTDPQRYGYAEPPHAAIDARTMPHEEAVGLTRQWLTGQGA